MHSFLCVSAKFQPISGRNSPKSATISQRHRERNARDFRAVYFNLFLVILPKLGSTFCITVIPYKPLRGIPLLGFPVLQRGLWPTRNVSASISVGTIVRKERFLNDNLISGEIVNSVGLDQVRSFARNE